MERAWPRTQASPARAQRSASQVPGEEAGDADDEIRPIGGHGLQPWVGGRLPLSGLTDRSLVVQEANRQAAGVAIAAPITRVGRRGESPEVSSAVVECGPHASSPMVVCRGGGLNKYQDAGSDGPQRTLFG